VKGLLVPALAAAAGLISLVLLFPHFDPSASIHQSLDRKQAIAKAKQLASERGVDTAGWQAAAIDVVDGPTGPFKIQVALSAPAGKRYVTVTLFPDGRLAGWKPLELPSSETPPARPQPPDTSKAKVRRTWSGAAGSVSIQEGDDDSPSNKRNYWPLRVIAVFWYMAAMVYLPVAVFRRRLHYRVPLMLMGAQIAWAAVSFWGTSAYQKVLIERLSDTRNPIGLAMSSVPAAQGWAFFWLFVFAAVGFSIRATGNREKWASLELLAQGRFFNRAVGSRVAAGLLCGSGIAALPYLLAATGLFRGSSLVLRSAEVLAAPFPNAVAWSLSACVLAVGLFGFAYPLAAKLRNPYFRWALFAPVGVAIVGTSSPFTTPGANLAAAVLLFMAYALLYLHTDLLATMAAMVAAQAVLAPCVLLSQPGGVVRALAVPVIVAGAAALAVSLNSAIRGREGADAIPDVDSIGVATDSNNESGRVRLQAEFDVARKAQQNALPSVAPHLNGYSLAGSCEPAQQVGGDLYDYFSLADGRLVITVADVSGKGVPAALYMMVTKGLLAAATRDSNNLAYILEQVNLHLYRACKKKVFVTLAAVALDPVRRRLQHGRAGHNPVVWRRSGRGETVILKPPGLGLGMTAGERFNRTLRIEELELETGDAIVLYSDGITEAVDFRMDQYGEERLIRAVEKTDGQPAEESRAAILLDLAEFVGTTPARDDITLVVLRVAEFAVA
jgi:hypothetical protein